MIQKTLIFAALICLLVSFPSHGQAERDTLFYEIQPKMIKEARVDSVHMERTEYYILVRLKEDYHTKYEQLTGDNIGNFLAVKHEGEIIAPSLPVIQAKIPSGNFRIGPYKKEEKAREIRQQILNEK